MNIKLINTDERKPDLIKRLVAVWNASVKETHLFLSDAEINQIQAFVPQALANIPHLVVAENDSGIPVAFMGIDGQKLEMLFLAPEERGHGLGKQLLEYGIREYSVNELDVNEQNPSAKGFYEHMGFQVYRRSETDGQGMPYPILSMRYQGITRCPWAGDLPIYIDYHDNEWGRPLHDENRLFEMLILEGMQAGLSWITVLKKRKAFREAFDGFDPAKVALYGEAKIQELLANGAIIRNRLKINAAVTNAKAFLEVQKKHGSFDSFIWAYVHNIPIVNHWQTVGDVPATTPLSDQISRDLKKLGFRFVGSTIVYSFMQATGMVNDHLADCFAAQLR